MACATSSRSDCLAIEPRVQLPPDPLAGKRISRYRLLWQSTVEGARVTKWGLTRKQIDGEPWGIPAKLLKPEKTITDPIHGDVYLNNLETQLLDSPSLQRLRGVRQLGTSHLVYPGATHTRLSHALGALRAAQDLLDAVIDNRSGPRPSPDLLDEWSADARGVEELSDFDRNLAEVTVLTRLGALMHDMCHVAYGHTIEDDLKVLRPHDENLPRFRRLWGSLPKRLRDQLPSSPTCLVMSERPADHPRAP